MILGLSSGLNAKPPHYPYGGGGGTSGSPYIIHTLVDLRWLSEHNEDWGLYFQQDENIIATETSGWNETSPGSGVFLGFSPIGNGTIGFDKNYDGGGKTITGLYINRPATDNVGLFGFTNGVISNLGLIGVDIHGGNYVGAIGGNIAETDNCYATTTTGTVQGTSYIGGLCGIIGTANRCYSSCTVSGTSYVGGLYGQNLFGTITDCYATGSATGNSHVGGLLGDNTFGSLSNCFSKVLVSTTGVSPTNIGGLVGSINLGSDFNCFWDMGTSNQTTSAEGTGETTAQMKRVGTYLATGSWVFTLAGNIWAFNGSDNNGYPFLRFEGYHPAFIWLGSSSDWTSADNWSEGVVVLPSVGSPPGIGDKAIIPDVSPSPEPSITTTVAIKDLTIEANGTLTLALAGHAAVPPAGQLRVTGLLITEVDVPPVTTGLLVLESDASVPGNYADASLVNSSPNVNGIVKRFIPSDGAWHLLSCPVKQASMPPICDGYFAPLTTDFPAANSTYDFFSWDETLPITATCWTNLKLDLVIGGGLPNPAFGVPPQFEAGKGYLLEYQPGYQIPVPPLPLPDPAPEYKSFAGILGAGEVDIPITKSLTGNSCNLIGNPYPSSIDWKGADVFGGWDRSKLLPDSGSGYIYYVWNDAGTGNYGVYNSASFNNGGTNGTSRYIAPEQGFFVVAGTPGNNNVIMKDGIRCHSAQKWLKTGDNSLSIKVTSTVNTYSDEVIMEFGHPVTCGSEKWFSMYAEAPSLYLPVGENNYSIRFLNDASATPALPVSFKAGQNGKYSFTVTGAESFSSIYLQDLKAGSTQELKSNPVYQFTSSTTDDANRFLLRFTPLGIDTKQAGNKNIYVYDNVLNITNPGTAVIVIYNLMGQKLMEQKTGNETLYQLPLQLTTGYYIVTVTNGKTVCTEKVFIR